MEFEVERTTEDYWREMEDPEFRARGNFNSHTLAISNKRLLQRDLNRIGKIWLLIEYLYCFSQTVTFAKLLMLF